MCFLLGGSTNTNCSWSVSDNPEPVFGELDMACIVARLIVCLFLMGAMTSGYI